MNFERIGYIKEIFAKAFLVTRKWEVLFNRLADSDDITLKQLMLLIVAKNAFDYPPTIKELSEKLSTSHQNVKAISIQLQKKGFVDIKTDEVDKRVSRVHILETKAGYWETRDIKDTTEMIKLFEDIPTDDLLVTARTISKLNEIASKK